MTDLSRRTLLGALVAAPLLSGRAFAADDPVRFAGDPFTLGIASGEPAADGVVLWTRLAPRPFDPQGGMDHRPVEVGWEIAEDDGFRAIVRRDREIARPELAHSIHAEVSGLRPGRTYFYRFHAGGATSPTGRTRTAPAAGAPLDRLRFATCGCQSYESGWYTAYRHLADEPVDFVFHFGDYIYENRAGEALTTLREKLVPVRGGVTRELFSVDDYRARYTLGKLDHDLQAAHAAAPWFMTYDDHEVKNDWTADHDYYGAPAAVFALRRAAAMQAYYEHMPLRRGAFPHLGTLDITRRVDWGDLVRMHVLDTRLFRSPQPCGGSWKPQCPDTAGRQLTMLGARQEKWLFDGLGRSRARWNHIAQQVMMLPMDRRVGDSRAPDPLINHDSWAGYDRARDRLLDHVARARRTDVVVTTGDEHQNFAIDLPRKGRTVAAEFVCTSISSGGDGFDTRPGNERLLRVNPALKFSNDRRGYMTCDVTRDAWRTEFRVVDRVSVPDRPIRTAARFAVEPGRPGVQPG